MIKSKDFDLRFAAVIAAFVGVVFLTYREDVLGPLLAPLTMWTAQTTLALLHVAGIEAVRTATMISHPEGFAYEIYFRCTGVLPVAFLTVSILAYSRPLRYKLIGLAVGVPLLLALNFTRLVHLFYIGVHNPHVFDLAHKTLWEGFIILAVFGLWLAWRYWSPVHERETGDAEGREKGWTSNVISPSCTGIQIKKSMWAYQRGSRSG